jgi:hypothetical protein
VAALVQGLRIEQPALIAVAGKTRHRELALRYYQTAAAREQTLRQLAAFASDSRNDEESRFAEQVRVMVRDLQKHLNYDDTYAVLGATVRIENVVLDQYKRAIFHASETPASNVLRRQYIDTCDARDAFVAMRDRHVPTDFFSTNVTLPVANEQHHHNN